MGMSYWILAITQAGKERLATQNIRNQGFELYLPMYREKSSKNIELARPLFPRYIFVKVLQKWSSLTGTYGVSGLLMEGSAPKKVPDRVLTALQNREDSEGFVVIENKGIKAGDEVKISSGPLKDQIGIFQGMSSDERAMVLLKLLGSEREVKFNPKILVVG